MKKLLLLVFLGLMACAKQGIPGGTPGDDNNRNDDFNKPTCQLNFKKSRDCASLVWVRLPTEGRGGEFQLKFANEGGAYDVQSTIRIIADMEGMNHPVRIAVEKLRDSVGAYEAKNVRFSMRGEWLITIRLVDQGAVLDEVVHKYTF